MDGIPLERTLTGANRRWRAETAPERGELAGAHSREPEREKLKSSFVCEIVDVSNRL